MNGLAARFCELRGVNESGVTSFLSDVENWTVSLVLFLYAQLNLVRMTRRSQNKTVI